MPIAAGSHTTQVICSGRRPFFYSFDATTGTVSKIDRIIGAAVLTSCTTSGGDSVSPHRATAVAVTCALPRRSAREEPGAIRGVA